MDRRVVLAGILTFLATPVGAQQAKRVYRVAVVFPASKTAADVGEDDVYKSLLSELRRLGYAEGDNLVIERWAGGGRTEQYPDLAREMVKLKPDLIFTRSTPMVSRLKAATTTIPIVAFTGGDPVAQGLVASLARPGGTSRASRGSRPPSFRARFSSCCEKPFRPPGASRFSFQSGYGTA